MSASTSDRAPLILNAGINSTGYSSRSWDAPGRAWNRFVDYSHYLDAARIAHEGCLDALFLSDHPALQRDTTSRPIHTFDPIVLFSSLAAAVPDVGFFLTASTSYNSPYNLARRTASLDHISGGRLIWNAVTSFNPDIAANFGSAPLPERDERYRRGDEFIEVVKKLWRSWQLEDGPHDGQVFTDRTARRIDHHGEFFDVRGPLNVPIGPQGDPLIAQAGGSASGIDLAGKYADLVYAPLLSVPAARRFTAEVRARAEVHGREPNSVKFVPGLVPIIAETREAAFRRHEQLNGHDGEASLIEALVERLSPALDGLNVDDVIDPARLKPSEGQRGPVGFTRAFHDVVAAEPTTLRQLVRRGEGGHRLVIGTPEDVAADITAWWEAGVVDGFTLQFPVLPDDLRLFVDEVVPLLVAAGVRRGEYVPGTLREKFGIESSSLAPVGWTGTTTR